MLRNFITNYMSPVPSPGRNDQASSYAASSYQGSTSEWAKHDTQYRLNQHVNT